jgi:hypothetical protein
MTVSVPGAAIAGLSRQSARAWAVGSRFSPTRLIKTLPLAYKQLSLIILVEPPAELNSPPPDTQPTVSPPSTVPRRRKAARVHQPVRWKVCLTQTREYPTTGQAAAASGPQTRRWSENDVLGGWVDGHCVAEVFELRY